MIAATATYKRTMTVAMTADRFEELVADALDSIPETLMGLLDNVVILVADRPPDGRMNLLGLYEGHALTDRTTDYAFVLPDRITVFRRPILSICETEEQVIHEVRVTVVHEIAHHFGISEGRLHALGWG